MPPTSPHQPDAIVTTRIPLHSLGSGNSQPQTFICDWNPRGGVDPKYMTPLDPKTMKNEG